jgi:predicted Zn-dependent peptidase
MLDRKNSPIVGDIANVDYLLPEKWSLSNGLKVWGFNVGSQELVKIDFIFEAGAWYQSANLIAGLTNAFMNQGSVSYSAQQIAEAFDSRGAYLQLTVDQQLADVTVLTLNKHLEAILQVVADVIKNPVFPQKEVKSQIGKKKQQFIVENNKVKTLAQKKFTQVLYGREHPYANTNAFEDYDLLTHEQFIAFHRDYYVADNCKVIVAGKYDDMLKNLLEKYFGGEEWKRKEAIPPRTFDVNPSSEHQHFVEKSDALQSAIRIGCIVPNRNHSDFHGLNVLVTILGGYFGSRLMTNVREDKGYTYGIGAGVYSLPNSSYLSISTEVGSDVYEAALKEIYYEIERLQSELVGEEELGNVRNYLLGESLRSFDGVFALSESLKTLIEADLDYSHYEQFVDVVRTITPGEIRDLALKYFNRESLFEIIAGK